MLVELFRNERLQSTAKYVRKYVLLERKHVSNEDTGMKVLKLRFFSRGSRATLSAHDRLQKRIETSET